MSDPTVGTLPDTDRDWEQWGRDDPYFGVITDKRFRRQSLDDDAREAFFMGGEHHVAGVLDACRKHLDPSFSPRRILEFGCGVGRLLIPFARHCEEAVGVDVSPSMLEEARRNCTAAGASNVELVLSDDEISRVEGRFSLVHSALVLQHIPPVRGRRIFERLVDLLEPGGAGVLQITFAKAYHAETFGQPPSTPQPAGVTAVKRWWRRNDAEGGEGARQPDGDPRMLMHAYSLSEIAFIIQRAGVGALRADFTDHGGEIGAFLYFRRPMT